MFKDNSDPAVAYASNETSQGGAFILENTAVAEVRPLHHQSPMTPKTRKDKVDLCSI